jgi:hypothetical protein
MSSSQNPQQALGDPSAPHPFKPPSAVTALEKAIQQGCETLASLFRFRHDNDWIKRKLAVAWFIIHNALDSAGDPNMKKRLRNEPEFNAYLKSDGGRPERELIELLRSMANNQVPWSELVKNGTLLSAF